MQAASLVSAYPIIAVDLYEHRLKLAALMGATHLINSSNEDVRSRIAEIVGNVGIDAFIDNTGQPAIIEMGYQLTKPQGRVTLVGVPRKGNEIHIYSLPLHFGKELSGSYGGNGSPQSDIPRYHNLFRLNRIKLRELITDLYDLEEINEAIQKMRDGRVQGRCLIQMKHLIA